MPLCIYILKTILVAFSGLDAGLQTENRRCSHHFSVNWDETQASPHFKFVNTNFNAFVHCSSELNWILREKRILFQIASQRLDNKK